MVGSSKRSILCLGKQAESYKVMIYAPLAWKEAGAEGEDDREHHLRGYPREHTRRKILERQPTEMHLLLRSNHNRQGSRRQHETRHYDTDLPSRAVTNRLSGVPVTPDDTSRLTMVQVV